MSDNTVTKKTLGGRCLDAIERVGNKLPPPAILFCWLFVIVAVIGAIFTWTDFSMINPAIKDPAKAVVKSQNLFSEAGINWLLNNLVKNFTGFAPMGLVVTMTLAIGMCEEAGLLKALLAKCMRNVPPTLVPFVVAFLGTCGNIASDTAMIVIPPMAAIAYIGVGKNPIVGMINGYAGAQAGFSANLMIAGTDSLLQGLTNLAIKGFIPDSTFTVEVTCNWFFMMASTFLCAIVIGGVCTWVVEPRFGKYEGSTDDKIEALTPEQSRGLRNAGLVALAYIALLVVGFFWGPLAKVNPDGSRVFVGSLMLKGLIPLLFFFFALCGITYGYTAGSIKSSSDLNKGMVHQAKGMGAYIVFCFFAGQFNMLFNWTKLGTMLAIGGADFLKGIGFTGIPMCVAFILLSMVVNLFVSSGSAKWAIFAPIFVPMFMLLGYHPGFTQLLYRLGDSPTNAFTPMSPYIWMVLSVAQAKYDENLKIGTLISALVPVAFWLQIIWIIFFIVWDYFGLPIGPGVTSAIPAELAALLH
ncbi:MAG: AbgT family transporter [Pyramidobacter sp.]|nr:AbgT family transporter [Pyramidobacter sp.]